MDESLGAGRYAGCILLADISGYSTFLNRVQAAHADDAFANDQVPAAYSMMSGFLEGIASTLDPPMSVLKFEGDAAFAICTHEATPQGSQMMRLIEGCYSDFRSRLAAADQVWTCTCDACSRKDNLDLKFVVHHGGYYIQAVGRQVEAVGPEVNVAHRLLKTRAAEAVRTSGYALFTREAIDALDLDLEHAAQVNETVDDGRLIEARVVALSR